MKKQLSSLIFIISLLFLSFIAIDALAQCPMCKIAAESNLLNGGSKGQGLNVGILYMLAIPYILMFGLGFIWWRRNGRFHDREE